MKSGIKTLRKGTDSRCSHRRTPESASSNLAAHPVLQLQQQAGNQAVQDLLRAGAIHARLEVSQPEDPAEREADQMADQETRSPGIEEKIQRPAANSGITTAAPAEGMENMLTGGGQPLEAATRTHLEAQFNHDFSHVRIHTDGNAAASARAIQARAFTDGKNVAFAAGQYAPGSTEGMKLLAHEMGHVVQRSKAGQKTSSKGPAGKPMIQRKVEMRNVGRGEQSGFARLPELINRLNALSQGLIFSTDGTALKYEIKPGGTLSNFDRQMMVFIDQDAVIPLKLTNRQGRIMDPATGRYGQIQSDAWVYGYVDIDDLLASTDLGLQIAMVHFLRERTATANYAHRIGSPSLDISSLKRGHSRGIDAEVQLLKDFFGDPTIRFAWEPKTGEIFRVYVNRRGDHIRLRVHSLSGAQQQGVDQVSVEVITRDGVKHTPEDYRRILHP